jgi:hypothetical protein
MASLRALTPSRKREKETDDGRPEIYSASELS